MEDFSLDASYDAIVCLFSSIGYLPDADALRRTMHTFSDHLAPGGVIVVEPWLSAQQLGAFQSSQLVCADGLEIARIARHRVDGDKLTLWLHYLAGGPDDVRYFVEEHRMSLFSNEDYRDAFEHAGLECVFDPVGLSSRRGLYVPPAGRRMSAVVTALPGETGLSAWDACFRPQRLFPSLERDESCDFLVIGAGYAGLSAARAAAGPARRPHHRAGGLARRARRRRAQCRLHDRRHPRPGLRRLRR